jgi:ArsR family transcriptional regulator
MTAIGAVPDLLQAVAEPTRLRIINCLAAAPLVVSDLQTVLDLPQPTVSRHLQVLRRAGIVRDTPIARFVLYRLRRPPGPPHKLMSAILDAMQTDPQLRAERELALVRSHAHTGDRLLEPETVSAGRSRRPR